MGVSRLKIHYSLSEYINFKKSIILILNFRYVKDQAKELF